MSGDILPLPMTQAETAEHFRTDHGREAKVNPYVEHKRSHYALRVSHSHSAEDWELLRQGPRS